jgi:hypothetical protein
MRLRNQLRRQFDGDPAAMIFFAGTAVANCFAPAGGLSGGVASKRAPPGSRRSTGCVAILAAADGICVTVRYCVR